jgi:N-acetylglucosaminyl-diphospho-decaprenol L-rhamnosyltransferase
MADRMIKVTVIIVTYQSRKTIGYTLDTLKKAYDNRFASVVVIDNASMDGTADIIEENYPWVILVRNKGNIGFGKGCNSGFKHVITPYMMFLNPDAVIDKKSLKTLIDFMEQSPNAGMCGPILKDSSGERRFTNILPTPWNIIFKPVFSRWISRGKRHILLGDETAKTEWLFGACMLLRKEVFKNIGGFDPRFFLYFEETDLSLRIRQSGWEIWIVGGAICEHVNAASAKETEAHMIGDTISEHYFKSRLYYLVKHFGWFWAISAEVGEIMFMSFRAVLDLARGRLYKELYYRLHAPILKLPSRIYNKERMD